MGRQRAERGGALRAGPKRGKALEQPPVPPTVLAARAQGDARVATGSPFTAKVLYLIKSNQSSYRELGIGWQYARVAPIFHCTAAGCRPGSPAAWRYWARSSARPSSITMGAMSSC